MRSRALAYPAALLALTAVYVGVAKLGLLMALHCPQVSPVWPPTGIAVAALFLWGPRLWPAITLGAFLTNVTAHEPAAVACGIAAGNTLEAVASVWLLHLLRFRPSLEQPKDVLRLLAAAAAGPVLSATLGVGSLCLGHVQLWHAYWSLWWIWWLGDAMGMLLVAPAVFTTTAWPATAVRRRNRWEAWAFLVVLIVVGVAVFSGPVSAMRPDHPMEYAVFPIVIWAAFRFGQPGAATAALVTAAIAVVGTLHGAGPFTQGTIHESLIRLVLFLAIAAVTALFLGAAVSERQLAEGRRAADYAVSQILAESSRLEDAAPRVLSRMGETLGWTSGRFWNGPPGSAAMRCLAVWRGELAPPENAEPAPVPLRERVRTSGQPETVLDVRGARGGSHTLPAAGGRQGAFAFPVRVRGKVTGVMEWFACNLETPDRPPLQLLTSVSGQVGQFIERTHTEEAIRQSEERYRTLVEQAADGIFLSDLGGSYLEVNNAGCAMTGYSRAEMTRLAIDRLLMPDQGRGVVSVLEALRAERAPFSEWVLRRKDGRLLPVEVSAKFLADGRLQAIVRDITHRKQAEQAIRDSEKRFRALFEKSWDAVAILSADGSVRYCSPSVERILGYPPADFQGMNRMALVHPQERTLLENHATRLLSQPGASYTIVCRYRRRDGGWLWIEGTGTNLLEEPTIRGLVWNFRDISERKGAEEAQQEADRRKDEFLAMLAHELRNPLAPIRNAIHLLRTGDSRSGAVRGVIERQVETLTRLVDDLLDVSRITRGKVQLHKQLVDVGAVVGRAVEAARPLIEARGHHHRATVPRADLVGSGCHAPGAGGGQPAQQCGQVHAGERPHRVDCRQGWCGSRPARARRRRRHRAAASAAYFRAVHARRSDAGAFGRRAWHRADGGTAPG